MAPAAGVLLCENALLWLFALAEKKQGEERMESALSYTRVIENDIVLFFLFSFLHHHHALFELSHRSGELAWGNLHLSFFFFETDGTD